MMYNYIMNKTMECAMSSTINLGKNVRKYRKIKNMTQSELAERLKLLLKTFQNGRTDIRSRTYRVCVRFLCGEDRQ